ncbi:hypothetical protein RUM44_004298 [Polyplax serrata]|uniref:Uncharacterized protein n=1 Tax=Polyplax serrata TaxID=468196 RepID=A0ABR1B341_POLSC
MAIIAVALPDDFFAFENYQTKEDDDKKNIKRSHGGFGHGIPRRENKMSIVRTRYLDSLLLTNG